jgi:hypothetical protein
MFLRMNLVSIKMLSASTKTRSHVVETPKAGTSASAEKEETRLRDVPSKPLPVSTQCVIITPCEELKLLDNLIVSCRGIDS